MKVRQDAPFAVYVLHHRQPAKRPDAAEQEVVRCPTYEDAKRVSKELHASDWDCVIRYEGDEAGGGD